MFSVLDSTLLPEIFLVRELDFCEEVSDLLIALRVCLVTGGACALDLVLLTTGSGPLACCTGFGGSFTMLILPG